MSSTHVLSPAAESASRDAAAESAHFIQQAVNGNVQLVGCLIRPRLDRRTNRVNTILPDVRDVLNLADQLSLV